MTLRRWVSMGLHAGMFVMAFVSWGRMVFRWDDSGRLSSAGLGSLRYFTVLSNLLQGVVSALTVIALLRIALRGAERLPAWLRAAQYMATTSVGLTFATVMVFLGPVYGYASMMRGANLWMHLIIPLTSVFCLCVLEREGPIPFRWSLIACLPVVCYGVFYLLNLKLNFFGLSWQERDWYVLARGGWRQTPISFSIMLLAVWVIALLIRLPRRGDAV